MPSSTLRFLLALTLVAGCSTSTEPPADAGHDSGTGSDSGSGTDLGGDVDAGTDLGTGTDLGADLGTVTDGGPTDGGGMDLMILPPFDAGMSPFDDGGTLGDPAWVPVDVRTDSACDPLTPCGGDVVGTWDVTGACIAVPIGSMLSMCPGAAITSSTGMARGRVSFDATTAHRVAQSEVDIAVFVPALCAGFLGGCDALATRIQTAVPDSACVADSAGNCNCALRQATTIDNTDSYTLMSNEIVTGAGKHYAYCVSGTSLQYEDTTPGGGMREPGIITLGMR